MRVGVLGPSEDEINPFIDKLKNPTITKHIMLNFYSSQYHDVSVVAAFCGVGKVNAAIATQVMIDKFQVDSIILTGVAGSLNDNLQLGDVVVSTEVAHHDVVPEIITEYHPWLEEQYIKANEELIERCIRIIDSDRLGFTCYFGRIITGETFITHQQRNKLIDKHQAMCVDMESASVAQVCYINNIPFIAIRAITDHADSDAPESFEVNVKAAALNSMKLVENLLIH
ncbi:MAG TPA: phosphoglycerate transporter [Paenibacillus sp.]|nr:phosphoglycerate transporter [Paenibacillus sp.]